MKYLYLIDFNQPFPSSEYGGLIAAIASGDTECHSLLLNEGLWDEPYTGLIMPAVVKAQKFALQEDYESGILEAFTT
jgi:hypothetical protein